MSSNSKSVHASADAEHGAGDGQSYQQQHRASSTFESREAYLEHELTIMNPKRWRANLPGRDYRFEAEDSIAAMAATIERW